MENTIKNFESAINGMKTKLEELDKNISAIEEKNNSLIKSYDEMQARAKLAGEIAYRETLAKYAREDKEREERYNKMMLEYKKDFSVSDFWYKIFVSAFIGFLFASVLLAYLLIFGL